MGNKINPRKIPRTQVDVDRAAAEGRIEGAEFMATLMCFVLKEDFAASHEHLRQIADRTGFYARQIEAGEVRYRDVRNALDVEFDVRVRI